MRGFGTLNRLAVGVRKASSSTSGIGDDFIVRSPYKDIPLPKGRQIMDYVWKQSVLQFPEKTALVSYFKSHLGMTYYILYILYELPYEICFSLIFLKNYSCLEKKMKK